MSVRHRLLLGLTLIVALTALVGIAGVAGLQGLSGRYAAAEEQYAEMRSLYEVGHQTAAVRLLLNAGITDREVVSRHLESAAAEARKVPGDCQSLNRDLAKAAQAMLGVSKDGGADEPGAFPQELHADVNRWLARVATLAAGKEKEIVDNRRAATMELERLEAMLGALLLATVAAAAMIGMMLYRTIMRPLRTLNRAIEEIAGSRYQHRVKERGGREFRHLMRHFNRMSESIEALHSSMARQVEVKSRQLVRSEQLAGVGFLAAGLAHEINNPLAIIAGYSQAAMRRLDAAADESGREDAVRKARSTLEVVCEETFRCRDIAAQLMDLARPTEGEPGLISLPKLAQRAIDLVSGLPVARGCELVLRRNDDSAELVCRGHTPQLLQVLINLLTNALEACPAETGRVIVTTTGDGGAAFITVTDNGRGMDGDALAHAFDPFFTDKPRRGLVGCGLGLSISHAIIERHQGRLYAHSEGPGQGCVFTVEVPIAIRAEVGREEAALA